MYPTLPYHFSSNVCIFVDLCISVTVAHHIAVIFVFIHQDFIVQLWSTNYVRAASGFSELLLYLSVCVVFFFFFEACLSIFCYALGIVKGTILATLVSHDREADFHMLSHVLIIWWPKEVLYLFLCFCGWSISLTHFICIIQLYLFGHVRKMWSCSVQFFWLTLFPLGGGPSFILARHLQHRAEDGGEREETADGPRLPCEDRVWTPRNLPWRAGTERNGRGQAESWGGVKMERVRERKDKMGDGDGWQEWEEWCRRGSSRGRERWWEKVLVPLWGWG